MSSALITFQRFNGIRLCTYQTRDNTTYRVCTPQIIIHWAKQSDVSYLFVDLTLHAGLKCDSFPIHAQSHFITSLITARIRYLSKQVIYRSGAERIVFCRQSIQTSRLGPTILTCLIPEIFIRVSGIMLRLCLTIL
jgi:hypothetical protein